MWSWHSPQLKFFHCVAFILDEDGVLHEEGSPQCERTSDKRHTREASSWQ